MKKIKYDFSASNIQFSEKALDCDFIPIKIYAISEGQNRNRTSFLLGAMEEALLSFYEKPILGYFNIKSKDFEEHNSDLRIDPDTNEYYWSYVSPNAEKPLGIIRTCDMVTIEQYKGKNWIVLTASLWAKYAREPLKALLKAKTKKISVEISVNESFTDEDGIEVIESFTLDGITILGKYPNSDKAVMEGIEGAHLQISPDGSALFSKQMEALRFAYNVEKENENEEEIVMKKKNCDDDDDDDNEDEDHDNENEEEEDENDEETRNSRNGSDKKEHAKDGAEFVASGENIIKERGTPTLNKTPFSEMTFEQKRQILSGVVEKAFSTEDEYAWLCDFTDSTVIYCVCGKGAFEVAYTVGEDGISISFAQENAPVIFGYITYSADEKISATEAIERYVATIENLQGELVEKTEEYLALQAQFAASKETQDLESAQQNPDNYIDLEEYERRFTALQEELEQYKAVAEEYNEQKTSIALWKEKADELDTRDFIERAFTAVDKEIAKMPNGKFDVTDLRNNIAQLCKNGTFASDTEMETYVKLQVYEAITTTLKDEQFAKSPVEKRGALVKANPESAFWSDFKATSKKN